MTVRVTRRAYLLAFPAATAVLAACGPFGGDSAGAPTGPAALSGTIEHATSGGQQETDYLQHEAGLFRQQHPAVQIVDTRLGREPYLDKLVAGIASDSWPDVFWMNVTVGAYSYAARGWTHDITQLARRDRFDWSALHPLARNAVQRDGKTFAMTRNVNTGPTLLFWNRAHFDEAGVPPPTEKMALRDLASNLVRLSRPDEGRWGMEWGAFMSQWPVYASGGRLLNKDGTESLLTSSEVLDGLQYLHDLIHRYRAVPASGASPFNQGRAATWVIGSWAIGNLQQTADSGLRAEVMPAPNPRGLKLPQAGVAFYIIRKGSRNVDLAWAWVKHLMTLGAQVRFVQSNGLQAAVRQANFVPEVQQNPMLKLATDHLDRLDAGEVPKNGNTGETIAPDNPNSVWIQEIAPLRAGTRSVQETAAEMKRRMDLILKQPA
ncbi:MAG: extracellular solute-binding protein [Chloroflexi bacterium]|nr:extracellular solute-binding protein [Chloroflexota bacterium]